MNKKIILITLLSAGLFSCSDSNSSNSSPSIISTEPTVAELLTTFYEHLSSLEGKVKSTEQTIFSVRYYLTDATPLTIGMKEVSTTNRYISDQGPIVVQKGSVGFADKIDDPMSNKDNFETQTFHDETKFYRITDYDSEDYTDTKAVLNYDTEYEEQNLNIGFPMTEKVNIEYMIQVYDQPGFQIKYKNMDGFVSNGTWDYAYELIIFEENTSVPAQVIGYHNKLSIQNNIILKVEQEYYNELYSGGIKTNWVETTMVKTYTQGEFDTFTGTRFEPNSYNS